MDLSTFQTLGVSVGLGLLVGLQRESVASPLGGIRTFALVTLMGSVTGLLSPIETPWWPAAGLLALAGIVSSHAVTLTGVKTGLTTAIAMLVMYALGAYLVHGDRELGVAIGVSVAFLLFLKEQLHSAVAKLKGEDIRAILQFALLAFVILPLLPNRYLGLFNALNPHHMGLMVILIVGINVLGYIAYQMAGGTAGTMLSGLLGGLISSTATTVSYARREKDNPLMGVMAAAVITIASAVMYFRLFGIVTSLSPGSWFSIGLPLGIMGVALAVVGFLFWRGSARLRQEMPVLENPSEMKTALFFALVYGAIMLGSAALTEHNSETGLRILAFISGLTDVDAITLATINLVDRQSLSGQEGLTMILIASGANLFFKTCAIMALGSRRLLRYVGPVFVGSLLLALVLWSFW